MSAPGPRPPQLTQEGRVAASLECGWRTLGEVAMDCRSSWGASDTEAAISARIRDLRRAGLPVEKRRRCGNLWEYRIRPTRPVQGSFTFEGGG